MSYAFENEVRALIQQPLARGYYEGTGPPGKPLEEYLDESPDYLGLTPAVDLHRLIDAIHVSPSAPAWFADLVRSVVFRYGLGTDLVVQSQMAGSPVY